jgi:hypothetical protein
VNDKQSFSSSLFPSRFQPFDFTAWPAAEVVYTCRSRSISHRIAWMWCLSDNLYIIIAGPFLFEKEEIKNKSKEKNNKPRVTLSRLLALASSSWVYPPSLFGFIFILFFILGELLFDIHSLLRL